MTRLSTSRTQAAERAIAVFVLLTVAALLYTRCDVVPARAQETSTSISAASGADVVTVAAGGRISAALFLKQRDPARLAKACFCETSASSITVMHTPVTRENGGSNPSLRAGSRSFVAGVVDPETNRSTGSANADEHRRDGGERPALFLGQRDVVRIPSLNVGRQ